ncbi:hypothetical protein, partial [uncultured Anaerovibrio sp.]|uniref:hypothetical protein n=1 Tax=uncultured Anaerovibrio sp. TaxID=361586 RepID=UPI00262A28B0
MSIKRNKNLTRLVLAGLTLGVTSAMLPISAASAGNVSDTVTITDNMTPEEMDTYLDRYQFPETTNYIWHINYNDVKKLLITGVPTDYQGDSFAGALNYTDTPDPINLSGFSATLQGGKVKNLYGA